jgi:hypothetical protein
MRVVPCGTTVKEDPVLACLSRLLTPSIAPCTACSVNKDRLHIRQPLRHYCQADSLTLHGGRTTSDDSGASLCYRPRRRTSKRRGRKSSPIAGAASTPSTYASPSGLVRKRCSGEFR